MSKARPVDEEIFLSILDSLKTPMYVGDLYKMFESRGAANQISVYLTTLDKSRLVDVEMARVNGREFPIWKINVEGMKVRETPSNYEFPNPWDDCEGIIKLKK